MLWSPDGNQLVYRSNRTSASIQLYRVAATGVGGAEMLLSDAQQLESQHATTDSDRLVARRRSRHLPGRDAKDRLRSVGAVVGGPQARTPCANSIQRAAWLDLTGFSMARLRIGRIRPV